MKRIWNKKQIGLQNFSSFKKGEILVQFRLCWRILYLQICHWSRENSKYGTGIRFIEAEAQTHHF